jgi:hypothetical protein
VKKKKMIGEQDLTRNNIKDIKMRTRRRKTKKMISTSF